MRVKLVAGSVAVLAMMASTSAMAGERTRSVAALPSAKASISSLTGARAASHLTKSSKQAEGSLLIIGGIAVAVFIAGVWVALDKDGNPKSS